MPHTVFVPYGAGRQAAGGTSPPPGRERRSKAHTLDLTSANIRQQTFKFVEEGYDPQDVTRFLGAVADTVDDTATDRASILAAAESDAAAVRREATRDADRIRRKAEEEAAARGAETRHDALQVMAQARRDGSRVIQRAQDEEARLEGKLDRLRAVVARTENLMRGIASGALDSLAHAWAMLDEASEEVSTDVIDARLEVVLKESGVPGRSEIPLPAEVDRLLSQVRDIG